MTAQTDPAIRSLDPQQITPATDTRDQLAHARKQAIERNLDDYFIVDVDAHHGETASWSTIMDYIEDPVMRHRGKYMTEVRNTRGLLNSVDGLQFQDVSGRIVPQSGLKEAVDDDSVHRNVTLIRRVMDAIGIDIQIVFPNALLNLGLHPDVRVEVELGFAYNRWIVEHILAAEPRIRGFMYLPFNDPEAALKTIRKFGDQPGVAGFVVTSQRHRAVHDNAYMPVYAELEERGLPLTFHASVQWEGDQWMRTTDRFMALHAISFVHCNMVHLTNWIIGGIPERFPNLKPIWVESGLAWLPFLMQRLDHHYLMRQSDAPLLKRMPSEYIREMYFTSQPMENTDAELTESTFKAISAETQLMYSSDWPHWDWDPPSHIYDLPFLSEQGRRNILGETARRVFNL
jgi:predicted TIM-barrel fold metal-dependent hydrolase